MTSCINILIYAECSVNLVNIPAIFIGVRFIAAGHMQLDELNPHSSYLQGLWLALPPGFISRDFCLLYSLLISAGFVYRATAGLGIAVVR